MRAKVGITIVLLLLLLAGWRVEQRRRNAPKPDPATTAWQEWEGEYSGYTGTHPMVVRDQLAWKDLWDKVYGTARSKPSLPSIDFDRHFVVAVFGGQQRSGYRVKITGATREGDTLVVTYKAGASFFYDRGMVSPFHMAVYQAAPNIKFIKE